MDQKEGTGPLALSSQTKQEFIHSRKSLKIVYSYSKNTLPKN